MAYSKIEITKQQIVRKSSIDYKIVADLNFDKYFEIVKVCKKKISVEDEGGKRTGRQKKSAFRTGFVRLQHVRLK